MTTNRPGGKYTGNKQERREALIDAVANYGRSEWDSGRLNPHDAEAALDGLLGYFDSVEPETAQLIREGPKNCACRCGHNEDSHCVTRDGLKNLAECALVICACESFVLASTDEEKP